MITLLKKTGIYLLVFVIAIESSACATTQPAVSEPPGNISLQNTNKSDFNNTQSIGNQAATDPEERNTEDGGMATFSDTAGTVVKVVGVVLLLGLAPDLLPALNGNVNANNTVKPY